MQVDFTDQSRVTLSMPAFIEEIIKDSGIKSSAKTPASNDLFDIKDSPQLDDNYAEYFHSMTARLLYLSKRVRPDLLLSVTFLTTRVIKPTEQDMEKLNRVLKYLHGTTKLNLKLRVGHNFDLAAYVDASFATHSDYKSHTGAVITLGNSSIFTKSAKKFGLFENKVFWETSF